MFVIYKVYVCHIQMEGRAKFKLIFQLLFFEHR